MLTEPVVSIATQLAVIVGKVARLDVPKDWPTLLPLLLESIRSADPDKQYRSVSLWLNIRRVIRVYDAYEHDRYTVHNASVLYS
jgi:hypothetical protein